MALPPIGLGLMCKPPRPGSSKTRLAASIGPEAAALLSRAFLEDCAATVLATAGPCALRPAAYYRPADAAGEMAAILGPAWSLAFADAGDLGATMLDVLGRLVAACPAGAMVMGADIPAMGGDIIARAAGVLREGHARSVVIAPSADGGYGLIGIRSVAAVAPLFAPMAWSTSEVLAETLRRAERHGLDVTLLPVQRDIDDASDLDWLRREVAGRPDIAPRTQAALARIDARADHG
jgi:rSAM/selenodomain-associated transferase 1